jgi:hypothetical protein
MKDFRLAAECQCHVDFLYNFFLCKIDVGQILYRKLCIVYSRLKSVEAEGVTRLTSGRLPGRQPSWTTGDGLGTTERSTTVLNI